MPTLYSYVVAQDHGAAPNPFWGVCTLAICKPRIRLAAQAGDWIVGTGSVRSPVGDMRGHVVYAMRVTRKLPLHEYIQFCQAHLPKKLPHWYSSDPPRMVGDAIFDFNETPPRVLKSVHDEGQRARDLSGRYALLSEHFFYFGDQPIQLPPSLHAIAPIGQGHRSRKNSPFLEPFLFWLTGLGLKPNQLYGKPAGPLFQSWSLPEPPPVRC